MKPEKDNIKYIMPIPPNAKRVFKGIILSILIAQTAGIVGSLFTFARVDQWYIDLVLPALAPPAWVFGPVWVTLYTLMGIAAFLVWRQRVAGSRAALKVYGLQLAFNALWSIIFFGLRNPGGAFVEIIFLWLAIIATIIAFAKISKPAAWLLLPYLVWVSFAAYLNYEIWILN